MISNFKQVSLAKFNNSVWLISDFGVSGISGIGKGSISIFGATTSYSSDSTLSSTS